MKLLLQINLPPSPLSPPRLDSQIIQKRGELSFACSQHSYRFLSIRSPTRITAAIMATVEMAK